jgi:hypothetical protein
MGGCEVGKITGVALISIGLGSLLMVTSGMLIRNRTSLIDNESSLYCVWIFTVLTIVAGFLQFLCGFCLLIRKIVIGRWMTVNATAFLTLMLAVCILSTTVFRDHRNSMHDNSIASETDDDKEIPANPSYPKDLPDANDTEILSMDNFGVEEESPTTISLDSDGNDKENLEAETTTSDPRILTFYCATLIADFLALPILLGIMATRVKQTVKGKLLLEERTYVYPIGS